MKLIFIIFPFQFQPRFRIRENTPRFRLETQESQWSSRFNQNSFQPIDDEKTKSLIEPEVDNEQEIVTASSDSGKVRKLIELILENYQRYYFSQETFLFNVTASVSPTKPSEKTEDVDDKLNMISTTEKDFSGKRIKNEE